MKQLFLAGIAFVTLSAASPAWGADLRVKAPPIYKAPPPVAGTWTGFYVGGNVGYGWDDSTVVFAGNNIVGNFLVNPGTSVAGATPLVPISSKMRGGTAGLQAGYNWQVTPVWMVGFEADFNWSRIKGDGQIGTTLVPSIPLFQTVTVHRDIAWHGTVRGRLGWLPAPNVLVYGTAGFAYGRVRENVNQVFNAPGNPAGAPITISAGADDSSLRCVLGAACLVGASSRVATGWTAGGGAEFAVTPNISVKGELLYVRLDGDAFAVAAPATVPGFPIPASMTASYDHVDLLTVRIGLNFRFGGKAPVAVMAKY